jgi:competence protein ComEC
VQQQPALPPLAWGWLLLPLALLALRWPRAILPLMFFLAGVVWVSFRAGLVLERALSPELEGRDLEVIGRIADLPSPVEHGLRFRFDIEQATLAGATVDVPARVQLNWSGPVPALVAGDQWRLTVRLRRPHGFQNPGGFDREAHLFQQRVRATGYVREKELQEKLATRPSGLHAGYRLDRFRQQLSLQMRALLPDHPFIAMVTAFANGDDDAIPDDQWEVLNRTGTSHLIAISGMNIGFVAGLAFLLLRRVWAWSGHATLWMPAPRVAALGAMLAALGYAALAGFAIPTVRALIMLAVAMSGVFFGAQFAPSVLLAAALLVVLVWDPLSVMSAGFWLSFIAVAVILYAIVGTGADTFKTRISAWGRVQLAIGLALFPVLLFMFQQASLAGPFANLLAIPVVELIVIPATLAGVALNFLAPAELAVLPLLLAAQALAWLWPVLVWFSNLPGVIWAQSAPPLWAMAAAVIGALLLLAPRGFPARWMGIAWILPLFVVRPATPAAGEAWLTLLDVGQGLSAVVRTQSHTLVFDTGPRLGSRFDTGRAVVVPYLRHAGVRELDVLMISHGDNDHIGGATSVLKEFPAGKVQSSVPERLPNALACERGQRWEWDGVRFVVLNPDPASRHKGNNRSCVLRIETAHGRALLPADIARPAERRLVREQAAWLPAEVLVAPHHGSKSSSSPEFLEAVQPKLLLVPVGYRNRYRHPHPDVVARYRERGVVLADSAASGAIEVRFAGGGYQIEQYRQAHRRYWHLR